VFGVRSTSPQAAEETLICSNYRTVTGADRLLTYFGVEREAKTPPPEVSEIWPLGLAPFIRLHEDGSGNKVVEDGLFGLLPFFAKEVAYGRKTFNSRSETVDKLPSFRESWKRGRRCIIPAVAVYEPNWESGKAVRWRVSQPGDVPMGLAGVYSPWTDAKGVTRGTFAMLTVNADGHPVYQHFHRQGDEKRMIVILDPTDYDRWLTCAPEEAKGFFRQWTKPLDAVADPLPPRKAKTK
jgi:putative SOS response-associated peptidase YedK